MVPCDQAVNIATDAEDHTEHAESNKHIDRSHNISAAGANLHLDENVFIKYSRLVPAIINMLDIVNCEVELIHKQKLFIMIRSAIIPRLVLI